MNSFERDRYLMSSDHVSFMLCQANQQLLSIRKDELVRLLGRCACLCTDVTKYKL